MLTFLPFIQYVSLYKILVPIGRLVNKLLNHFKPNIPHMQHLMKNANKYRNGIAIAFRIVFIP